MFVKLKIFNCKETLMAAYSSVCLIAVQTAVNAGDYLVSPQ